jgi:hypothetical protein
MHVHHDSCNYHYDPYPEDQTKEQDLRAAIHGFFYSIYEFLASDDSLHPGHVMMFFQNLSAKNFRIHSSAGELLSFGAFL